MKKYAHHFKNKKIMVMGLGLLGRGVGDAAFLAECGAKLTVSDLKKKEALAPSLKKLAKYKNITYVLGMHRLKDFQKCDMILQAAGVPLSSPYIKEARKHAIPVVMSGALLAQLSRLPVVGITGTRGKSTVAYLITHILKTAGKRVILGGNVRDVSNLKLLKKVKKADILVMELDSWQLKGFGERKISPHLAVFTTFYPDHLNYYGSMRRYFADKAHIFTHQGTLDMTIVGRQALPYVKKWGGKRKGKIVTPRETLPYGWHFSLPGKHNEYNAVLALAAARMLGIPDFVTKRALLTFPAVPGRLEMVRKVRGVRIYNDTNATTPEATLAALHTLGSLSPAKKNIVLIMGGEDKGLDMGKLMRIVPRFTKAVVFLSGTGTERIRKGVRNVRVSEATNMQSAVKTAYSMCRRGDILLMSPAFASFGMFKNEYDRGEQFNAIVGKIK